MVRIGARNAASWTTLGTTALLCERPCEPPLPGLGQIDRQLTKLKEQLSAKENP